MFLTEKLLNKTFLVYYLLRDYLYCILNFNIFLDIYLFFNKEYCTISSFTNSASYTEILKRQLFIFNLNVCAKCFTKTSMSRGFFANLVAYRAWNKFNRLLLATKLSTHMYAKLTIKQLLLIFYQMFLFRN